MGIYGNKVLRTHRDTVSPDLWYTLSPGYNLLTETLYFRRSYGVDDHDGNDDDYGDNNNKLQ